MVPQGKSITTFFIPAWVWPESRKQQNWIPDEPIRG